eukprot:1149533-Pelagomonas_calceolata.AAC.3
MALGKELAGAPLQSPPCSPAPLRSSSFSTWHENSGMEQWREAPSKQLQGIAAWSSKEHCSSVGHSNHTAWRKVAWREVAWRKVAWRKVAWREVAWREVAWRKVAWREVAWREVAWREAAAAIGKAAVMQGGKGRTPCSRGV